MSDSQTSWTASCQAPLSFTISWSFLRFMSIELMMLPNHFNLRFPLLLLPSVFPSIRVFSNDSALVTRWPKYLSSASVLPMNIQDGFPLGLSGLNSLQCKEHSRVFSSTFYCRTCQLRRFGMVSRNLYFKMRFR